MKGTNSAHQSGQQRHHGGVPIHADLVGGVAFVLVDEDHETICDLYLVDDDTIVLDGELMAGLSDDLDSFWEELSSR